MFSFIVTSPFKKQTQFPLNFRTRSYRHTERSLHSVEILHKLQGPRRFSQNDYFGRAIASDCLCAIRGRRLKLLRGMGLMYLLQLLVFGLDFRTIFAFQWSIRHIILIIKLINVLFCDVMWKFHVSRFNKPMFANLFIFFSWKRNKPTRACT